MPFYVCYWYLFIKIRPEIQFLLILDTYHSDTLRFSEKECEDPLLFC